MQATIEHVGADVLCRSESAAPAELRLDGDLARAALEDWAARYEAAVHGGDVAALLAIGRELEGDRRKQLRAALRAGEVEALAGPEQALSQRALAVAAGNPGLQATQMTPLLNGEAATAAEALEAEATSAGACA